MMSDTISGFKLFSQDNDVHEGEDMPESPEEIRRLGIKQLLETLLVCTATKSLNPEIVSDIMSLQTKSAKLFTSENNLNQSKKTKTETCHINLSAHLAKKE